MSSSRTEHPSMNAFSLVTVPRCCLAQHPALSGIPPGPHSLRQEPAIRAGLAGDSWSRLPLGRAEAEVLSQVWWVRPRPHLDTGLSSRPALPHSWFQVHMSEHREKTTWTWPLDDRASAGCSVPAGHPTQQDGHRWRRPIWSQREAGLWPGSGRTSGTGKCWTGHF